MSNDREGEGQVFADSVDITPAHPMPLAGFASRTGSYTTVRVPLEANILGLRGPNSMPIYIVSVDTLYAGEITNRLLLRLSIDPVQIIVCASHTHFAPSVDPDLRKLGGVDIGYLERVVEQIAGVIERATWTPGARLAYASIDTSGLFINRRRPVFGFGLKLPRLGRSILAPHRAGPIDPTARVVGVRAGGRFVALLWGVSCHPVCSPDADAVSPCFPGEVRRQLRGTFGPGTPVLFLQGFSGDVRPASVSRKLPRSIRAFVGYLIAGGISFIPQGEASYRAWCQNLGDVVSRAVSLSEEAESEELSPRSVRYVASKFPGWTRSPTMQRIYLSRTLSVLGVNAEVVNQRIGTLTATAGGDCIIPAGCCNDIIGYWPTDEMQRQGGYEAGGSECFFPPLDWHAVGGPDALWEDLVSGIFSQD